ncbi:unnamed protein product [Durusdinium trenchii]|uniref:Uncharacterized protein n=2 Tax=Durusdinium trenchii TaxID=1381693 RepID=A0ABP0RB61_9DINO
MDRYRVVPADGEPQVLELEKGISLADAYVQLASLVGAPPDGITLLLRNAPSSALPVLKLPSFQEAGDSPLWQLAAPGSVLLVEFTPHAVVSTVGQPSEPRTKPKKPRKENLALNGLRNLGNTCYLNSALQCLSQTPLLRRNISQCSEGGSTCRAFVETLQLLEEEEVVAPAHLKACVATHNKIFAGSGQQDAQEFLQTLLEALHQELSKPTAEGAEGPSVVTELFDGQLRSEVCCPCGAREVSEDPFWSLPLPLPKTEAKLFDLLEAFCSPEALEGWSCSKCQDGTGTTRQLRLQRLPQVLQLHLKRFEWRTPEKLQKQSRTKEPSPAAAPAAAPAATPAAPVAQAGTVLVEDEIKVDRPLVADDETPSDHGRSIDPLARIAQLPWEKQEVIYVLLLRVLQRIRDQPQEPKFRALQRSSAKLQELLEVRGGEELLRWCGFQARESRYEADGEGDFFGSRHDELQAHAMRERDRAYRIARDQRIEAERRKALPTGDTGPPLRRWGGVLPGFGAGARRLMMSGMECLKITTRIMLDAAPISERPRGLKALDLRSLMPDADASDVRYELSAVIQHLGTTPFSGHYVAYCWHHASQNWYCFDDARVRKVDSADLAREALNEGAYVLFLERVQASSG